MMSPNCRIVARAVPCLRGRAGRDDRRVRPALPNSRGILRGIDPDFPARTHLPAACA